MSKLMMRNRESLRTYKARMKTMRKLVRMTLSLWTQRKLLERTVCMKMNVRSSKRHLKTGRKEIQNFYNSLGKISLKMM